MTGVRFLPRSKVVRGPGTLATPTHRNQNRASVQGRRKVGGSSPFGSRNANGSPLVGPATGSKPMDSRSFPQKTENSEYYQHQPSDLTGDEETSADDIERSTMRPVHTVPSRGTPAGYLEGSVLSEFEAQQAVTRCIENGAAVVESDESRDTDQRMHSPSEERLEEELTGEDGDQSGWKDDTGIKVIVRARPLNSREIEEGATSILRRTSRRSLVLRNQSYVFDSVAGPDASQKHIFGLVGRPMVENCLAGFNSSIFAYGQTGSGKTHTMMGESQENGHSKGRGLTPRLFEELFQRIREEEAANKTKELKYACKCSFLEIYNEQIMDLLDPSQRNIQLREDTRTGVYVEGLTEEVVSTVDDVNRLLYQGMANRKVAATAMNNESSRSHSVFTCTIESQSKNVAEGVNAVRFARLNLVDLAGSERQKLTGAAGERLREAGSINRSLSQLGNVIKLLADMAHSGKSRHIPYRDSRLTFLLQESLGGNARTAMVFNVSPASTNFAETLGTLKFAQRAKAVQNKAKVNEERTADVNALRQEIRMLKAEITHLKSIGQNTPAPQNQAESMVCTDNGVHEQFQGNSYVAECTYAEEGVSGDNALGDEVNGKPKRLFLGAHPGIVSDKRTGDEGRLERISLIEHKGRGDRETHLISSNKVGVESGHGSSSSLANAKFCSFGKGRELNFGEQDFRKDAIVEFASDSERVNAWRRLSMLEARPSPLDRLAAQLRLDLNPPNARNRSPLKPLNFQSLTGSVDVFQGSTPLKNLTGKNVLSPLGPYSERTDENSVNPNSTEAAGKPGIMNARSVQNGWRDKASPLHRKTLVGQGRQVANINSVNIGEASPDAMSPSSKEAEYSAMEALLAGALRREKVAMEANKKLMSEIEQLNCVVKQYKQERVCHQILQQARDERNTRLEELADKLIPAETFLGQEWSSMSYQRKVMQDQLLDHPEVAAKRLERQRLEKELERMSDFCEAGERESLMSEVHQLRDHVLTLLNKANGGDSLSPMTPIGGRRYSFSTPDQLLVRRSIERSMGSPKLLTNSALPDGEDQSKEGPELEAVEEERHESIRKSEWEEERGEWLAKEAEWGAREEEWVQLVEEQQEKVKTLEKEVEEMKAEVETQQRLAEEAQDAIGRAFEGHRRLLDQYDDLQERHIALLAKQQKINNGVEDLKKVAGKSGVNVAAVKWFTTYAAKVTKKEVESERQRQDTEEEVAGLRAQLKNTAETASELLTRLRRAENIVALSHAAAGAAEKKADELKRENEKLKRRHFAEKAKLEDLLKECQKKCGKCATCKEANRANRVDKTPPESSLSRGKRSTPRRSKRASGKRRPLPVAFLEITESFDGTHETGHGLGEFASQAHEGAKATVSDNRARQIKRETSIRANQREIAGEEAYVYSLTASCELPVEADHFVNFNWGENSKDSPPTSHGGSGSWVEEATELGMEESPPRYGDFKGPESSPLRQSVAHSNEWNLAHEDVHVLGDDDNPLVGDCEPRVRVRELWRKSTARLLSKEEYAAMEDVAL